MPKKIVEYQYKVGYWSKGEEKRGKFVTLTNFCIRLLKYVQAPEQKDSGFVVEVTQLINSKKYTGCV